MAGRSGDSALGELASVCDQLEFRTGPRKCAPARRYGSPRSAPRRGRSRAMEHAACDPEAASQAGHFFVGLASGFGAFVSALLASASSFFAPAVSGLSLA